MAPKKPAYDMTAPEMTRVTVRVPKTTLDQIGQWVDELGVRRSHFLGIALVAGSRLLVGTCSREILAPNEPEPELNAADLMSRLSASQKFRSQALAEQSAGTLPAVAQSAVVEMQNEIAALRAEVSVLESRLAHADKTRKGRRQALVEQGGPNASAPSAE